MILNILLTILFLLGMLVYAKNKKWAIVYCLLIQILSLPVLSLLANCPFQYPLGDVANLVNNFVRYYYLIVAVLLLLHSNINKKCESVILTFFIFSIYVVLSKLILTGSYYTIPTTILDVAIPLILFIAIYRNPKCNIGGRKIWSITKKVILLEFIVSAFNIVGIFLFIPHYFPTIVEGEWGNWETLNESKVAGTFDRYNTLAGFLATIYMFVLHLFFIRKQISKTTFLLTSAFLLCIVITTGAKISLVSMLLFLIVYSFKYIKKMRLPIIGLVISFSFIITLLANYTSGTISNEGIDRQLTGFSALINGEEGEDNSTLSLSSYLIDNYFHKAPIFGNNNLWKGDEAYGNFTNHRLTLFNADAKLALVLVDSGIVGFMLTLACFWSIFKLMMASLPRKDRWGIIILFCYYLIQTVTDGGFYDIFLFPLSFVFYNYLRNITSDLNLAISLTDEKK